MDVSQFAAAAAAFPITSAASDEERCRWLHAMADALDAAADELVPVANAETRLPEGRLRAEVGRTTGQLRLLGSAIAEGGYREAVIDTATATSPDLRRTLIPIGPVAVYAASNFPFAFSVAGGDTAAALAVGAPVVVKAHPGHPELSRRTAAVVTHALRDAGAPDGFFGLVEGWDDGVRLVQHPAIAAAAFTGSTTGGRALFDLACARPDPIPFYGELGSVNPVVITANAVAARGHELADGLVGSFTLGSGQFCTKPGIVFVSEGAGFEELVAEAVALASGAPMLNKPILERFTADSATLQAHPAVRVLGHGKGETVPLALGTTASAVATDPEALLAECFGPVVLLAAYRDEADLAAAVAALAGSLTATIHAEPGEDVTDLLAELAQRAGRVLFAGWPTGVAVTWAQHHGGPWPATTASLHTSVGVTSMRRFLRPLVYQDAPQHVLPQELHDANPRGIWRRIDGELTREAVHQSSAAS